MALKTALALLILVGCGGSGETSEALEPLGPLNPTNAGSVDAPVQSEILRVRWHDNTSKSTSYGEMSVRIDASGKGSVI